jgi:predicted small lipoprotein YifL
MRPLIVLPLLALLLSACGYKGALYLPTAKEQAATKPGAPATSSATPAKPAASAPAASQP